MANIKKIQLPNGEVYDIYDAGAARAEDLEGLASETYVNQKVADLVNSAPETLDTLGEVAAALQENEDVVDALNMAIGSKVGTEEVVTLIEQNRVQGDWSENNPESPSYIQGRTHYEVYSSEETQTISGLTYTESGVDFVIYKATGTIENLAIIYNSTYVVQWPDYWVACLADYCASYAMPEEYNDKMFLGNAYYLTGNEGYNTGEPFLIIIGTDGYYETFTDDNSVSEVIIEAESYTVVQLGEQFIPDTIARTYQIEELTWNVENKVEKVDGKQLSTEDFTTEEKEKLAGIAAGANAYTLPNASNITKGGVTIGNNITVVEGNISITGENVTAALGYTPAQSVSIDTSLSISGAAADAKAVGDAFDALDTIIALDENADGNVVLQSYIQADEEGDGYVRLDTSLTVEGIAPDSKAVGDAINLRMLGTAIIPIAQGGHGKTTASEGFKALQSRGVVNGDMNEMMTVGVSWIQLSQCTNTPYGDNPESGFGFLEIFDPEEGEILQRYTQYSDGVVWIRSYVNSTWTGWFEGGASNKIIPISQGGTGATTAAAARTNLGALSTSGGTITGTLYINNATDGSSTTDNNVGLIIGPRNGTHIIFDGNEIIAKANGTTGGTLCLGDNQSSTYLSGGKILLRSSYSYGTSLPTAGTAGRIFFKKV